MARADGTVAVRCRHVLRGGVTCRRRRQQACLHQVGEYPHKRGTTAACAGTDALPGAMAASLEATETPQPHLLLASPSTKIVHVFAVVCQWQDALYPRDLAAIKAHEAAVAALSHAGWAATMHVLKAMRGDGISRGAQRSLQQVLGVDLDVGECCLRQAAAAMLRDAACVPVFGR